MPEVLLGVRLLLHGCDCHVGCRTPEHKTVTTWVEPTCLSQEQCKPHLVGIRDSFQVAFQQTFISNLSLSRTCTFQPR
jgi:hypothetical protein